MQRGGSQAREVRGCSREEVRERERAGLNMGEPKGLLCVLYGM